MITRCVLAFAIGSTAALALGFSDAAKSAEPAPDAARVVAPYVPGLGDFMTAYVQPHHIKLWFAGRAANWALAAYEANELAETFEDVATYQSTWKDVPVAQLVKSLLAPALHDVNLAIADRSPPRFKAAYVRLTAGCNACHRAAGHDFLVIKVPTLDSFPDQEFLLRQAPPRSPAVRSGPG